MSLQTAPERESPKIRWYLAQIASASERRVLIALRQHRLTTYRPMETIWKSVPQKDAIKVQAPYFPGYLFVALCPGQGRDLLHEIDGLHIVPTKWPAPAFAAMVADMAFRQCAGEFDKTGSHTYLPAKPMVGPMDYSVGHGLSALAKLKGADEQGRIRLLTSGELINGDADDFAEAA